jgi:hypothetical protein
MPFQTRLGLARFCFDLPALFFWRGGLTLKPKLKDPTVCFAMIQPSFPENGSPKRGGPMEGRGVFRADTKKSALFLGKFAQICPDDTDLGRQGSVGRA